MVTTNADLAEPEVAVAPYRLTLLGSFALQRPDGSVITGLGRKARALLAIVAISGGPVDRARLAKMLWSDRGQDQARASLRQTFYELRQQLPPDPPLLVVDRESVSIARRLVTVDIDAVAVSVGASGDRKLLEDLDHIDPGFDQWLNEQHARYAGSEDSGEGSSSPPTGPGARARSWQRLASWAAAFRGSPKKR